MQYRSFARCTPRYFQCWDGARQSGIGRSGNSQRRGNYSSGFADAHCSCGRRSQKTFRHTSGDLPVARSRKLVRRSAAMGSKRETPIVGSTWLARCYLRRGKARLVVETFGCSKKPPRDATDEEAGDEMGSSRPGCMHRARVERLRAIIRTENTCRW